MLGKDRDQWLAEEGSAAWQGIGGGDVGVARKEGRRPVGS